MAQTRDAKPLGCPETHRVLTSCTLCGQIMVLSVMQWSRSHNMLLLLQCGCTVISTTFQCHDRSKLHRPAEIYSFLITQGRFCLQTLETTSNCCFFGPASPHFVYLNLFMGGEDELSTVMKVERSKDEAFGCPCIASACLIGHRSVAYSGYPIEAWQVCQLGLDWRTHRVRYRETSRCTSSLSRGRGLGRATDGRNNGFLEPNQHAACGQLRS